MGEENVRKKRAREDSTDLGESKRVQRENPDLSGFDGDEAENFGINNGIPEDILDGLDDGDNMPENQYLDSVIRSFEEEILQSSPSPKAKQTAPTTEEMNLRSDSGEYQLDLGYLLEASDDELGLPPTHSSTTTDAEERQQHQNQDPIDELKSSDSADFGEMFGFENEIPKYSDSFGFEFDEMACGGMVETGDGGFGAAVDGGVFEYSEPSDPSADLSWLCGCT